MNWTKDILNIYSVESSAFWSFFYNFVVNMLKQHLKAKTSGSNSDWLKLKLLMASKNYFIGYFNPSKFACDKYQTISNS